MQTKQLLATLVVALGCIGSAQAAIQGSQSDSTVVEVGTAVVSSPTHTGTGTGPGIGINAGPLTTAQKVAFSNLKTLATNTTPANAGNVTTYKIVPAGAPHPIGHFNFAQINSKEIYFGERTSNGNSATGNQTVYYVGEGADTSISTAGTATYSVKGINDYTNKGLLIGEFTANFATKTLEGYVTSGNYELDIGTVTINNNATLTGNNTATFYNGSSVVAANGNVDGRFYDNQTALAGLVKFATADRQYDTAFGGTKNP